MTSSFSAKYGLLAGSQTVMVSKSGTHRFHGSAFEYLRNSALDAANYFDRPTAANNFSRLPAFKRNFGGSFGGPIRKDRTFFHLTYEQVIERLGVTVNNTVPAAGCNGPDWAGYFQSRMSSTRLGGVSHHCSCCRPAVGVASASQSAEQQLYDSIHSTRLRPFRSGPCGSLLARSLFRPPGK